MKTKTFAAPKTLPKSCTGIRGLDEITGGGLPTGRPTLVCGAAGCGKTLLAMEFLVRGATECDEPGVFMTFEETGEELAARGEYNLEGLFIRLGYAIDSIKAKRVVLDTIERTFRRPAQSWDRARGAPAALSLAQEQRRDGHHHLRAW
jgi:circadian clock protein KaiC